jgi:hypothetical protein
MHGKEVRTKDYMITDKDLFKIEKIQLFFEADDDKFVDTGCYLQIYGHKIKTTVYEKSFTFVVYHEYVSPEGTENDFDESPSKLSRCWVLSSDYKIKTEYVDAIKKNVWYQKYSAKLIRKAMLKSVGGKVSDESKENVKFFNQNRSLFTTKESAKENDWERDNKRQILKVINTENIQDAVILQEEPIKENLLVVKILEKKESKAVTKKVLPKVILKTMKKIPNLFLKKIS